MKELIFKYLNENYFIRDGYVISKFLDIYSMVEIIYTNPNNFSSYKIKQSSKLFDITEKQLKWYVKSWVRMHSKSFDFNRFWNSHWHYTIKPIFIFAAFDKKYTIEVEHICKSWGFSYKKIYKDGYKELLLMNSKQQLNKYKINPTNSLENLIPYFYSKIRLNVYRNENFKPSGVLGKKIWNQLIYDYLIIGDEVHPRPELYYIKIINQLIK